MKKTHRKFSLFFTFAMIAGCSPAAAPIASSSSDPSNPSAPEGAVVVTSASASASASAKAETYVCPMHPEVTSTTPGGTCPKCHMKLVKK